MSYDLNSRNRNLAESDVGRIDHIDPAQPDDSEARPTELDEEPQEPVAVSDVPQSEESVAIAAAEQPEQAYRERLPDELPALPAITLWPENVLTEMRSRWQAAQLRFVDNPAAVTGEMQVLVDHAVQALSSALVEQQRELDGWQAAGHDTEQLRIAVQRYRAFYELMLNH